MRERDIEKYLVDEIKKIGGETRKLKWIGRSHAPDQVVLYRGSWFVEVKASGEKPRPGQLREHVRMRGLGIPVWVIDSLDGVDEFVEMLKGR